MIHKSLLKLAACLGGARYLVTCDDEFLNRSTCVEGLTSEKRYRLKVRNPVDYIRERLRAKR